ncbi:hypothetical protein N4P33_06520 [Streptomyces sp. 15-116A]|uniref:hypothetical protein n=1 Tax=Streptomyces sp. 15-116A TaxID=2259035 RepID=UPI0021B3B396|nr:hypothetical protein [Streptomyces sp. 15-116A]MCT7351828.1 hypothetical protein [Streptomyces sp. 15-116A]
MSATESDRRTTAQPQPVSGVPMRDLLAACAAAAAISTPPRVPEAHLAEPVRERREAA